MLSMGPLPLAEASPAARGEPLLSVLALLGAGLREAWTAAAALLACVAALGESYLLSCTKGLQPHVSQLFGPMD